MLKFVNAHGTTIEVTQVGRQCDLHVRDSTGRTVATVCMPADSLTWALLQAAGESN